MNKKEFESLTGKHASMREFTYAESVYMSCPDLDKRQFCQEWELFELFDSSVVSELKKRIDMLEKKLQQSTETNESLRTKLDQKSESESVPDVLRKASEMLMDKAEQNNLEELTEMASGMVGRSEALKYRLQKGYRLTVQDRSYILSLML